jgi:AraC-like DNA-binding protein
MAARPAVREPAGTPAYRELPPPRGLASHLACIWASHDEAVRVLPDGCIDLVFDSGRLVVAGPATRASDAPPAPGQARFGVRFRIGLAGAALGLPASELLDRSVPVSEIWGTAGRRFEDRVAAAATPQAGLTALVSGVAERVLAGGERDHAIRAAVLAVLAGTPLPEVGRQVGLGERQLRRRFRAAVGYGPATLVRIHRFQRFLDLAQFARGASLARLAADSGYADQAHLARECRRLAGLPPAALLAGRPTAAGEKSVLVRAQHSVPVTLSA